MTFDERMEKIVERHESLAQPVEMLVIENRNLAEQVNRVDKQLSELGRPTNGIALGTARLLSVSEAPENRITRLEDRL